MSTAKIAHLAAGRDVQSLFDGTVAGVGFSLTLEDRFGIERLLRHQGTKHAPNPPLLNGLLRHKLGISREALEPAPAELVVSGRHVTT